MKKWLANNAVALGALASVFAILWVVWQAQHQITESILESETRLEARFEIRMTQLEDRMTRLEDRMTRLEDKMDDIQSNLDARLDLVEREQAELRGVLEGMRR